MSLLMKAGLPLNEYWLGTLKPLLHTVDLFHVSRHSVLFLWHIACSLFKKLHTTACLSSGEVMSICPTRGWLRTEEFCICLAKLFSWKFCLLLQKVVWLTIFPWSRLQSYYYKLTGNTTTVTHLDVVMWRHGKVEHGRWNIDAVDGLVEFLHAPTQLRWSCVMIVVIIKWYTACMCVW